MLSLPFWKLISTKYGKKTAYAIGLLVKIDFRNIFYLTLKKKEFEQVLIPLSISLAFVKSSNLKFFDSI